MIKHKTHAFALPAQAADALAKGRHQIVQGLIDNDC